MNSKPETPPTRYDSLAEIKSGPREYTPEQAEFIERVVRERRPLDVEPLPIEDDDD